MADKTTVQITEDNIDELNIKVGTILKDNEGLYWKITDFNDFTAGMRVCDKDGNEIENFVGNAKRAIFGGGLSDLLNDGVTTYFIETEQPEIKKDVRYNYFVKDTAEFVQFADFEPITNLTAEEAVRNLIELNIKKGLSAGIGINIPDDFIFDDPDGNGAIIFMKTDDEYSFYMGDNFVKELKENNQHAQNVIAAFKELDNVIKTSVLGNIEVYKKPDFLYAKEKELFGDKNMEKKEIQITPVSLEEILGVMEMKPEVTPEGRIQIYDQQRGEYISTWVGQGDGDLGFEHASEIFERLDIYINDYFIHDMEEQLEKGCVTLTGNETLKDLCDYTKEQLEAGITTVSQGELNLAMGIVNPDTVIMPEGFLERTETTIFTLKNTTSEQIAELKEHLSMNGYDVFWKEKSKDSTNIQFSANFDEESWISTILDERNLTYTRSYEHSEEQKQIKENENKNIEIIQSARTAKLEQLSKNNNELTADDLKNARALLPKEQYQVVLGYTQGEEGEHFKGIIKEISSKAEAIKGKSEILTEDEKHPLAFKYTVGASSFYFSEWDGGDELFGYVVLNGNTQNSEWGYTSLEELKNLGSKDRNGFHVMPEMIFYGLEDTIEKQISVDYPWLSEQMGIKSKLNHNEELISEFGKEIFETLQSRKLEHSAYNICCAAQFVIRTMDSSEQKEIFSIMKKCGCEGKNGKANTEDFLTVVVRAENNTASSVYDRKRLYEKINKACSSKKPEAGKNIHNQGNDYDVEI